LEILVVLIIIGCALISGVLMYKNHIEKAKSAEAIITAGMIRDAEEIHKMETGSYVAAENTEVVNKHLGMGIVPKNYEYRVVGVTDDNFVVIAERIGKDIAMGALTPKPIVVAMDKAGTLPGGYRPPSPITTQPSDIPGGITYGGGRGLTTSGGFGGGGGGSSGGGSGQGSVGFRSSSGLFLYNSQLDDALSLLEDTEAGDYFYDLLQEKGVSVEYKNLGLSTLGLWMPSYWLDFYPEDEGVYVPNTIYINSLLQQYYSEAAIACVIVHEAVHADYNYNTEERALATVDRYGTGFWDLDWRIDPVTSELVLSDTLDQEYNAFSKEVELWNEIKGTKVNEELDARLAEYEQDDYSEGDPRDTKLWARVATSYPDLLDY
jgi:type II secretory pathway pseudopilin PulG